MNPTTSEIPALRTPQNIWLHGLWMVLLIILVNLALSVLGVCAMFQFLWMVFTGERNSLIAEFGAQVGNWLAITARFLSGYSDEKPFPWTPWR